MENWNWNLQAFSLLNAGIHPHHGILALATMLAQYCIYCIPVYFILLWFWNVQCRSNVLQAAFSMLFAILINGIIRDFWHQSRPFVLGIGHTYLAHAPDSAFPSNHMALMWAVGVTFLMISEMRLMGVLVFILALLVGWARIYLGVHFPLDMIGGMITGTSGAMMLAYWWPSLEQYVLPASLSLYKKIFAPAIKKKWIKE